MPLPKRQKLPLKGQTIQTTQTTQSAAKSKDSRFSNFETDAKFRLPSKKHSKTKLDHRFSRILTDPDFYNKASVDKYGRKRDKHEGKKELEKFYDLDDEESDDGADDDVDPESVRRRDRAVKKELAKVDIRAKGHDPIRDGRLSSSSDESSSDEEDEEEEEVEEQAELAGQGNEVPTGDITSRLAAVNMDWDNIRASDIMAVANSFLPANGRILSVIIYPSEFGMERLQREEIEGPPREIFASSSGNNKDNLTSLEESELEGEEEDDDDDEKIKQHLLQEGSGEDFDSKALRTYQLDRLRYYYAVITCSSPNAAKALYDNMDGLEYLSSANFFDLRFVPDETTFDEDPHDECERLSDGYKPNEFTTDALTHSKVKLTWDAEDTTRKEVQKRAFSRKEIDENELKAYLGSDSEEEDAPTSKADALRAALGLSDAPARSKSSSSKRDRDFKKPEGEMQVTFSAGLSANAGNGSVFENEPILDETTIEKYVRKQKERKQRRKERTQALKEGHDPDTETKPTSTGTKDDRDEEDPWNDPFFGSDAEDARPSKSGSKRSKKTKEREEREKQEKEKAAERANLELLMVDDEDAKLRHFDMNEIIKAEKAKKKGKNKKKAAEDMARDVDGFKINTQDPRFAKLYESHEFAIDPTNPKFKGTSGMKALLEEGRKKRKHAVDDDAEVERRSKKKNRNQGPGDTDDLKKLAARVKAKSKA